MITTTASKSDTVFDLIQRVAEAACMVDRPVVDGGWNPDAAHRSRLHVEHARVELDCSALLDGGNEHLPLRVTGVQVECEGHKIEVDIALDEYDGLTATFDVSERYRDHTVNHRRLHALSA